MPLFNLFSKKETVPVPAAQELTPENNDPKVSYVKKLFIPQAIDFVKNVPADLNLRTLSTSHLQSFQAMLPILQEKIGVTDLEAETKVKKLIEDVNKEFSSREDTGVMVEELELDTFDRWFPTTNPLEPRNIAEAKAEESLQSTGLDVEGSRVIYEKLAAEAIAGNAQSLERLLDHKEGLLKEIEEVKNDPKTLESSELQALLTSLESKLDILQTELTKYQSQEGVITTESTNGSAANEPSIEAPEQKAA